MSAARCACGKPAPDTTICRACRRELDLALITAALIEPDLNTAIARQARFAEQARRSDPRCSPRCGPNCGHSTALPYDQRAADAADTLCRHLDAWVYRLGPALYPLPTIGTRAHWLLQQTDRIARHPDASQAVNDISRAVTDAKRAIDRPPGRHYAGPCTNCGTDLLAKPGQPTVTCRACSTPHNVAERREWLRAQLEDHLGNASYVAAIATACGLRVTPAAVRMWASRGKLLASGFVRPRTPGGQPSRLYRVGDVLDLALARDTARPA